MITKFIIQNIYSIIFIKCVFIYIFKLTLFLVTIEHIFSHLSKYLKYKINYL